MKKYVLSALVGLVLVAAAPALAIEILVNSHAAATQHPGAVAAPLTSGLPAPQLSELPEPEVIAMMLVGLVMIGYRASRDSSEKFK